MKKTTSGLIADKIDQIDREDSTSQANIVALRAKRRDAVRSGDDAAADKFEKELLAADRLATLRAERREILVEERDAAERREQIAEFEKRAGGAMKVNEALAARVRTEGRDLSEKLMSLMNELELAEAETAAINKVVPEGLNEIASPNFMARSVPGVPRVDLEEKTIELWVFKSTGNLIGDQDRVMASSNNDGTGFIPPLPMSSMSTIPAVKRKFLSKDYHPAMQAQYPEPLIKGLRLPNFDRPGIAYDGQFQMVYKQIALPDAMPANAKPARRDVQTELTPLPQEPELQSAIQKVFASLRMGQ